MCDVGASFCSPWSGGQTLISNNYALSDRSKLTIHNEYEGGFDFEFNKTYQLNYYLSLSAQNGGIADFSNSAHLSFDMDKGVALTSSSGYQYGVAAVPEPETYAMLMSGLGIMGLVARRRKSVAKPA